MALDCFLHLLFVNPLRAPQLAFCALFRECRDKSPKLTKFRVSRPSFSICLTSNLPINYKYTQFLIRETSLGIPNECNLFLD